MNIASLNGFEVEDEGLMDSLQSTHAQLKDFFMAKSMDMKKMHLEGKVFGLENDLQAYLNQASINVRFFKTSVYLVSRKILIAKFLTPNSHQHLRLDITANSRTSKHHKNSVNHRKRSTGHRPKL